MKLNIFVSSTCYDLSQIRSDIKDFITEIGHNPILSEEYSFPIDTTKSSIENCIEIVRSHADLFILTIGNRYGSQINDGKSITNTEFLTALEKNIPIYTFTLKQMINILPVWKDNPHGNYSSTVDSPKIFEFIDNVRNKHNLWNFEFEKANDIKSAMKHQLSILLKSTLIKSYQLKNIDSFLISNLSSAALKIIVEKKNDFEVFYFYQLLEDEISKSFFLKNDHIYSFKYATNYSKFSFDSFLEFTQLKLDIMLNYIRSLNILMNNTFQIFFAESGVPSDLKGLYYVAHKYGVYYQEILKWAIEFNSLVVDEELEELRLVYAIMPQAVIQELEEFPQRELLEYKKALKRIEQGEKNIVLHSTVKLSISEDFNQKLDLAMTNLKKRKKL